MAWNYLFRKIGIPVPLRWNSVGSTLFSWGISGLSEIAERLILKDMRKIILYIAASLDQRIAEPDGSSEWLTDFPITEKANYGYNDFIASIDTILMGGRSYREVLNMDIIGHYKNQQIYVITRGWTEKVAENVDFITDNIFEHIRKLRDSEGKNIWLFGGGELTAMLLTADLIDEMQICYIPIILGDGIPLFPKQTKESKWELTTSKAYDSGILSVNYQKQV